MIWNAKSSICAGLQEELMGLNHTIYQLESMNTNLTKKQAEVCQTLTKTKQQVQIAESPVKTHENKMQSLFEIMQANDVEKRIFETHCDDFRRLMSKSRDQYESEELETIGRQGEEISKQSVRIKYLEARLTDAKSENPGTGNF
jgi:chromosome segregation ATPase